MTVISKLTKGSVFNGLSAGKIFSTLSNEPPAGDQDVAAFILAANITDSTQQAAINSFVTGAKAANLWTKRKAIYLFVGGTAQAHKLNLKDPRDLDAAFRISFSGGWTHSSGGIQGDGATNDADTHLAVNVDINQSYYSYSIYSRTDALSTAQDIGTGASSHIYTRYIDGNCYCRGIGSPDGYSNPNSLGMFQNNSSSSAVSTAFKNGTKKLGPQVGSGADPGNTLKIGHVVGGYSARQYAYADEGDYLNDADSLALYNLVQAFQTTLGRQV